MGDLSSQSLEKLLARAREGSRSALGRLLETFRSRLKRRAQRELPGRLGQKMSASDLAQESCAIAVARFPDFRGNAIAALFAWLKSIFDATAWKARRRFRAERRDYVREQSLASVWNEHNDVAASSSAVLDKVSRKEECERLLAVLNWCREQDRQVVTLHLLEGLSHEEIAVKIGLTPAAVRQRFSRAIKKVTEGWCLLGLLAKRGITGAQHNAIVLGLIQGVKPQEIATLLKQSDVALIERWIAEANEWREE
jgi:RNA polymerase sigma-70 factor (ECF subfamily)